MDTQPDVGDVMADIAADIRTIVRNEVELAKAEVVPGAKKAGIGGALVVVALIFLAIFLQVLFLSLGFAMTNFFWDKTATPVGAFGWGFLVAAGIYLVIAIILALLGLVHIKKLKGPDRTIELGNRAVDMVGHAARSGLQEVKVIQTQGAKSIGTDSTGKFVTVYTGQDPKQLG